MNQNTQTAISARQPQVSEATMDATAELEHLSKVVSELADRLAPIMRSEPSMAEEGKTPDPEYVEVASGIRRLRYGMANNREILQDILRRIEL